MALKFVHANAVLPPAETHVLRERDAKIGVEAAVGGQVLHSLAKMPSARTTHSDQSRCAAGELEIVAGGQALVVYMHGKTLTFR